MSLILTTANFLFPLITFSYVARVLSPVGTGRVAFVNSILSYFSYIAMLGIPMYGVREVAKVRDDKEKLSSLVHELLILNLLSTFIAYVLLLFAILCIPRLYSEKTLFIGMGTSIFLNTIGLEWVYQGLEEYSYITIRSIVFKIISVGLTFLLIRTEKDVLFYGFVHIFTNSASYIMNFFHVRKYIQLQHKRNYDLRKHIKPILTLFTASIIITIYSNFDVSMIGFISNDYEVGLYNSSLKIKHMVLAVSSAVTNVVVPRMSYYLKDGNNTKANSLIVKSFRVAMCLSLPIAVYIILFSNECITFFCGYEYLGAIPSLKTSMICIIPLIFTNLFGNQILLPSGLEKRYSQSVFVGLWINLLLNSIMIPKLGAFGASIATLITECWNVIWMSGGAKEYCSLLFKKINPLIYVISLVGAISFSLFISNMVMDQLFVKLAITAVSFFIAYYFILFIEKEPLMYEQCHSILKKLKRLTQNK